MIVSWLSPLEPWRAQLPSNEMVCSLGRSRMRNEMKMNNHHILSNTATWQYSNELCPKETISNAGRSKTSFSFSPNHISFFFLFTHLLTKNQHSENNNYHQTRWIEENWHSITRMMWNIQNYHHLFPIDEDLDNSLFDKCHHHVLLHLF